MEQSAINPVVQPYFFQKHLGYWVRSKATKRKMDGEGSRQSWQIIQKTERGHRKIRKSFITTRFKYANKYQ